MIIYVAGEVDRDRMELEGTQERYELIFEGPVDSSDETLRKIKGAFLVDLEMPAEQILSILQSTPATIQSSESPEKLEKAYALLKNAGSRVLIVTSSGIAWEPPPRAILEETVLFELDLLPDQALRDASNEMAPTYDLSEEPESDLENLLKEAAAGLDESPEQNSAVADTRHTFTLEIDNAATTDSSPHSSPQPVEETPKAQPVAEAMTNASPGNGGFDLTLSLDDDPEPTPLAPQEPYSRNQELVKPSFHSELSLDDHNDHAAPQKEIASPVVAATTIPETFNLSLSLDDDSSAAAPAPETPAPAPVNKNPQPSTTMPSLDLSLDAADEPAVAAKESVSALVAAPVMQISTEPEVSREPEPVKKQIPISPLTTRASGTATAAPENQGTPTDINLVAVRDLRKKKLSPAVEMAAYIGIGSLMLFMVNWFYFNQPPPVPEAEVESAQDLALKVAQKKKLLLKKQLLAEEQLKKEAELLKPLVYAGTLTIRDYQFDVNLHMEGTTPKSATVTVKSPAQPEPTNEQIARGEILPPWIRRIETSQIEFAANEDGAFSGSGIAKVFVEQQALPSRLVRKLYMQIARAESDGTLPMTISMLEGEDQPDGENLWQLEASDQGPAFSMQQKLRLTPPAARDVAPVPETAPPHVK